MAYKTTRILPVAILVVASMLVGCDLSPNHNQQLSEKTQTDKGDGEKKIPVIDNDKQFTILLYLHEGPSHVGDSIRHKIDAEQYTGWDGIYIVHKDKFSELFVGRYKTMKDAQKMLKKVRTFTYKKRHIYAKAIITRIPGQNTAPTTFDLRNAPKGKKYSVQVAVFYDIPEQNYTGHQQRAINLCQKLRDRGDEAYYFLTPNRSCVTLGSFPPDAIKTIKVKKRYPRTGTFFLVDKHIIKSKKMQAILDDNPYLLVCGDNEILHFRSKTGKKETYRQKTYPIVIPGR